MKKIDKEKSVVYSNYSDPDSLCIRGTFVDDFDYPDNYFEGTLCGIRANSERTFMNTYGNWYKYFVPESTMVLEEPKEKVLRPFKDIGEFANETFCEELGTSVISIRNKVSNLESVLLYTGYSDDIVCLGGYIFTFADLLENYEFLYEDKWLPFGIEDDE